jgi:hypothetical protein
MDESLEGIVLSVHFLLFTLMIVLALTIVGMNLLLGYMDS